MKIAIITNNAVQGKFGGVGVTPEELSGGSLFAEYFVRMWQGLMMLGALTVTIYFLWAGYEWIYAGGDSGKIQKARDRITQAIVGLIILVSSFVIIGFISQVFFGDTFDILKLDIPGLNQNTSQSGGQGKPVGPAGAPSQPGKPQGPPGNPPANPPAIPPSNNIPI